MTGEQSISVRLFFFLEINNCRIIYSAQTITRVSMRWQHDCHYILTSLFDMGPCFILPLPSERHQTGLSRGSLGTWWQRLCGGGGVLPAPGRSGKGGMLGSGHTVRALRVRPAPIPQHLQHLPLPSAALRRRSL